MNNSIDVIDIDAIDESDSLDEYLGGKADRDKQLADFHEGRPVRLTNAEDVVLVLPVWFTARMMTDPLVFCAITEYRAYCIDIGGQRSIYRRKQGSMA